MINFSICNKFILYIKQLKQVLLLIKDNIKKLIIYMLK